MQIICILTADILHARVRTAAIAQMKTLFSALNAEENFIKLIQLSAVYIPISKENVFYMKKHIKKE